MPKLDSQNQDLTKYCIIFLHVPKAGGSTLHKIIESQYPQKAIHDVKHYHEQDEKVKALKALPEDVRSKLRVIKGHMPFGLHEYISQPYTYISFMRDPIKRIVSHYYYAKSRQGHYLYDHIINNKMSLLDYANSEITPELHNYMVRALSGLTRKSQYNFEECTQEHLEEAKRVIQKYFCFVGLTEAFDTSLLLLKDMFKWKNIYYFKRKINASNPGTKKIPDKTLQAIEDNNKLDIELHKYVKSEFEKRVESRGEDFQKQLLKFKKYNRAYDSFMQYPYTIYHSIKGSYKKLNSKRQG